MLKYLTNKIVTVASALLIAVSLTPGAMSQDTPEEWIRPVRNTNDSYTAPIKSGTGDKKITVFKDEWVRVAAKGNGDIILGGDTLDTDKAATTDPKLKEKYDESKRGPLRVSYEVIGHKGDSIEILVNFADDSEYALVINQSKNVIIDTIWRSEQGNTPFIISKVDSATMLRVSPQNHLAVWQLVGGIEGYGKIKQPEQPVNPDTEDGKTIPVWVWYAIGGVLLAVIIGLLVWKREAIFGRWIGKKEEGDGNNPGNTPKDPNQTGEAGGQTPPQFTGGLIGKPEDSAGKEDEDKAGKKDEGTGDTGIIFEPPLPPADKTRENKLKEIEEECRKLRESNEKLDKACEALKKANNDLKKSNEAFRQNEEGVKKAAQEKADRQIAQARATFEKQLDKAERERDEARAKANNIANELKAEFEKERRRLKETISARDQKIDDLGTRLRTAEKNYQDTSRSLDIAKNTITKLEDAQRTYTDVLTYVPFADAYSANVSKLLGLSKRVVDEATRILDLPLEDPYHIQKFISRYAKALSEIDTTTLNTEIQMISKGKMVLKGSTLSTYDQRRTPAELTSDVRLYFFDNYLSKLVNALVVLNESMAGADRLVNGVPAQRAKVFADFRSRLAEIFDTLGIEVETVHLFDKIGNKLDLRANVIDAGFNPGDIIDIENAIVYLKGSHRPNTKILVTAQE